MEKNIIDIKLKNLIQICKETQNYKKLAVVSFILTSNTLDEIGIHLGLRARNRKANEKSFEYMELINSFLLDNLNISLFPEDWIETVKDCEIIFLKNKGNLPYDYIKLIFSLYYELRKLDVPNLYKNIKSTEFVEPSELGFYSYLAPHSKKKPRNNLTPLILQKIKEKELSLQKDLKNTFNSRKLENMIYLQNLKHSISQDDKGKITIQGALKDNLSYQHSIDAIFGYFIIGIVLLLVMLGIIMVYASLRLAVSSKSGRRRSVLSSDALRRHCSIRA